MYFRKNKGVTLLALTITVIVMLIITGTIIYNTNSHLKMEKINKFYNDIENINSKIDDYYIKYGDIPTLGDAFCNTADELQSLLNTNASNNNATLVTHYDLITNPNDKNGYYIIDLEKLEGLTLNYGYDGYKNAKTAIENGNEFNNINDIYIINKETNQIYYPSGVISDGDMYYVYNMDVNIPVTEKAATYNENGTSLNNVLSVNNFKIYGDSKQNGDPTPDLPVEIEGVGEKTSNLFNPAKETFTANGVTFTKNDDGTYTLNGTSTKTSENLLIATTDTEHFIPVYSGKYYRLSKNVISGTATGSHSCNSALYIGEERTWGWISNHHTQAKTPSSDGELRLVTYYIPEGSTFDNYRIGIQIEEVESENSTTSPYEPYGYKIPITVGGKNLIQYPYSGANTTAWSVNNDGSVDVNVDLEAGKYSLINIKLNSILKAGTYTFNAGHPDVIFVLYYMTNDGTGTWFTINNGQTKTLSKDIYYEKMYLQIGSDTIGKSVHQTIYPQLEYGSEITNFESYVKPKTYDIYLDEPLRKIENNWDYIDLKNHKVVRNIGKVLLNGEENWALYSSDKLYQMYTNSYLHLDGKPTSSAYATITPFGATVLNRTDYELGTYTVTNGTELGIQLIGWSSSITVDEWKTKLKLNPVKVYYILNKSQESQIELPDIQFHNGTNILTIDTQISPSNIELNYLEINK